MEKSFVRQTRSKTQVTKKSAGVPSSAADDVVDLSGEEFVPSIMDFEHGQDLDCAVCNRPNNAELFMVQCGGCRRWHHFSCARVDAHTVKSKEFRCAECLPKQGTERSSRSLSGRSSATSGRSSQIDREIQRLEDERRVEEEVENERIRQEKLLIEKAAKEKLDREKQFIARKHELLKQKDDENESITSRRSNRSSIRKVEDWVQQHATPGSCVKTENVPVQIEKRQRITSSTPLGGSEVGTGEFQKELAVGGPRASLPRTIGSVTIGESPEKEFPKLDFVDIQKYERLLDDSEPFLSDRRPTSKQPTTGTKPRIVAKLTNPTPFEMWHRETCQLRRQHDQDMLKHGDDERKRYDDRLHEIEAALQRQRDMELEHQQDNELRRRREVELVNRLNRLEDQHAEERKQLKQTEHALRRQLEESHLRYQTLEAERKLQQAAQEEQLHNLREREQHLARHLESIRLQDKGGQPTEFQQDVASSQPYDVAMCQPQSTFAMSGGQGIFVSNPHDMLVSDSPYTQSEEESRSVFFSGGDTPVSSTLGRAGTHCTYRINKELGPTSVGQQLGQQGQPPFNPYCPPEMNSFGNHNPLQTQFGPSPQQLAARQVISKELPMFSGDPTEWPLFISSYNHSTRSCGYSDSENLLRLQRALKGTAKESVSSFLLHPSTVPQIMATLQTLYGRPEQIVHHMVAKVRATPAPRADRLETLVHFGLVVQNLCGHLKAIGMDSHLSNPILLQELVEKLPANVKFSWALYQEQQPVVNLSTFGDYMERVTTATSGITNVCLATRPPRDDRQRTKEKAYVNTHAAYERKKFAASNDEYQGEQSSNMRRSNDNKECPMCKSHDHVAEKCTEFKKLSVNERWRFVKEQKLCRRCLVSHTRWPCEGEICGVNGCQKRHHRMLHYDPESDNLLTTTNATVTVHRQTVTSTLFKVLPVTLYGKSGSVNTYAFLDDGSSTTLLDKTIADELGVSGKTLSLCMQWTSGIDKKVATTQIGKLGISEPGSQLILQLSEIYTVENLGLPEQSIDYEALAQQYQHLQYLPVKSFQRAIPGLLIGVNNIHLLTTSKVREGMEQEPIAARTRIGWVICGRLRGEVNQLQHRQMHICAEATERDLHNYVREFFSVESTGVAIAPNLEGTEDQRARQILEETTVRQINGKFETGLLWKQDDFEFPDSRPMAERRLKCLERRLLKDPQLYDRVRQQVADYIAKGYIHVVTEKEKAEFDPRRIWYLPLGVVLNPNKPGKVRVIWDAAAKVNGVSLNTMLLKGPDLLTPQLTVTFKFREREVAFSGDIQEMFLQVGIRKQDRSALLFVFRNSPSHPMVTMVSDVAIFGATCSPAQSQFVKNVNAAEHEQEFPRAAAAITDRHYVDDYLDSVDTEEEAVELALEVATVHRKAGFHIRNWVSNKPRVLEAIGEVNPATVKNLTMNSQSGFERLLGIVWLPEEDVFCFRLGVQGDMEELAKGETAPTKRMMLSFLMRIYDPLGLVGSLVIQGKILIQDVWRAHVEWDQQIPEDLFGRWKSWLQLLKDLDNVKIQRCYFRGYDSACYDSLELHIFVDGSSQAYSAVAYFRVIDKGSIRCSLVASKTKVAPLQLLSTPRIELQAAVIGARLRKTIKEGHSIKIKRTCFWSDSSTVISWIRSDTRRYRQYVAFRVNEVLSLSKIEEWRWLGTKTNVADEATKWGKGPNCKPDSRWMRGPTFLYEEEKDWPKINLERRDETLEELRPAFVGSHFVVVPVIDINRFSKYERLLRSIAYVHRFCDIIKQRSIKEPGVLSCEDLQKAERCLCRIAQADHYPDELAILRRNVHAETEQRKALNRNSAIAKLPPQLDEHGIIRLDSRIAAAEYVSYDTKHPIIMPRQHQITKLLIDWYHRKYRHANNETIVNEIRQKFYIPKLRIEVRAAARRCQWCRVYKAKPIAPKMGLLPRNRITPFLRPFTFVGIDYFGPYFVKIGRSSVKRWVALFTCLTVRAIHMEVVHSLTTDSCKKAIRRFIARRGAPQEVYTDNGTNFVGASRELHNELQIINTTMSSTFTDANTKWRFNPPAAPHMGGCWERMVRSVKTALGTLPTARKLDDEEFLTLLAEVEHMVNSRPLTFVPLDSEQQESLTPNHFLMLNSNGVRQAVKAPVNAKDALKSGWNMVQHMLDIFWQRWIVEYLPIIARRSKWFQDVPPIKEGMLVVIADERSRNEWMRGRVIRTYPGNDGVVRKADVETHSGILCRSANKLAVLDVVQDGDAGKDFGRHGGEDVAGNPDSGHSLEYNYKKVD